MFKLIIRQSFKMQNNTENDTMFSTVPWRINLIPLRKNLAGKRLHNYKSRLLAALVITHLLATTATGETTISESVSSYVTFSKTSSGMPLAEAGKALPLVLSAHDFPGVLKVAEQLQADIRKVTGTEPGLVLDQIPASGEIVLIGTLGKNQYINELVDNGKISAAVIKGKWDAFLIETVEQPLPGVNRALLIIGSNKRGTIYGMFDLAEKIGVSPWYYWADVPVMPKEAVYIRPGRYFSGEPKVRYRGIFLNDEEPALGSWVRENFGDFNHQFYEKVFELILRLKGNFLWPAMWGKAFYDDDSLNAPLADEYGIVIGTSHHEPMMRAHVEWERYGTGPWNYEKNADILRRFWREGIERMEDYESIITIGMRGDGDEAMTEGTAIDLLERIVRDQRGIIAEVTGQPAEETPQAWALYKEVQDYYDKGMRVPDDVMLLLCDDNWGNVRILPKPEERSRKGGFGIYYHFDFVGGPVSYRWLNVTQIEKVWEQMNLAYRYGAQELWLVNVGDLKPMELPISFFLDFAWNPEAIQPADLPDYYEKWAVRQFDSDYAGKIAEILAMYTKFNARRTPEMLQPFTYSLTDYSEAETIVADYNRLVTESRQIYENIGDEYKDAFYQLVLFPVEICANLNEMYVAAGKNRLYRQQGRASTNRYAEEVAELFQKDAVLTDYYHTELADGKWNHMMAQTHIGYTSWDQPEKNIMPKVDRLKPSRKPAIGVAVEGSQTAFPSNTAAAVLPKFDPINRQKHCFEVFNKSRKPVDYLIKPQKEWINVSSASGTVELEDRIMVNIDWAKAPKGTAEGIIIVAGAKQKIPIRVVIHNPGNLSVKGFVENNGVVSIEAAHYSNAVSTDEIRWEVIPNLGRTHSAVIARPVNSETRGIGNDSPRLEYDFTLFEGGKVDITLYLNPTLNFKKGAGLVYGISVDDEKPQLINMHAGCDTPDWKYPQWWNTAVTDKVMKVSSTHQIAQAGPHVLKIWLVDSGIVFQKIIINRGGLKPSYLGPPESLIYNLE